jgi:hypothetical protein
VRYDGEEFSGQHEAIIGAETWAKAEAQVRARTATRGKGRGRRPKGLHLFVGGMLRCGECGEAMVPRTNRGHTGPSSEDYYCNGRLSFGPDFCSVGAIRRDEIDPSVIPYFRTFALDMEATIELVAKGRDRRLAEIATLRADAERQAQAATDRLARVRRDYADGKLDADDWRSFRDELAAEKSAALAEAERLERSEATAAEDLPRAAMETIEQIRAVVDGEIRRVEEIEAVRAVFSRIFDRFVIHRDRDEATLAAIRGQKHKLRELLGAPPRKQGRPRTDGPEYLIEIWVREEALTGRMLSLGRLEYPEIRRIPFELAANKNQQATPQTFTT